jgi:heat shock protein HslJ/uncharacterized lipoprotein NlpE involved in copper resistance
MKSAIILFVLLAVLPGCTQQTGSAKQSGPATTQPADWHTSQNSLDWSGTYEGVLARGDCPGIRTKLTLNRDGTYKRVIQEPGRKYTAQTVSGQFAWQANGNAIALNEYAEAQQFSVGEARLTLPRQDGGTEGSPTHNLVLTLVTPGGESDDLAQQLENYRWTLKSATDGQKRPIDGLPPSKDHPVVFSFAASRLSIQGPCNRIVGAYQINAAKQLTVNGSASTMMACDPALMQGDTALSAVLAKPLQVEIKGRPSPRLRLTSASNGTLIFTGQATPESLYGPATMIFLEVSAHLIACDNPPVPNTVCLQIRERHYDEHGLMVGTPGEWQPLYENIEGFTHTEGERNVLRVKRFHRTATPAGASSTVYVLDMMVESETVKP